MIDFSCSTCGKQFSVDDNLAGKNAKCNNCGTLLRIPTTATSSVNNNNQPEGQTKSCPYCGEQILAVAKKCKHCKSNIIVNENIAPSVEVSIKDNSKEEAPKNLHPVYQILGALLVCTLLFGGMELFKNGGKSFSSRRTSVSCPKCNADVQGSPCSTCGSSDVETSVSYGELYKRCLKCRALYKTSCPKCGF